MAAIQIAFVDCLIKLRLRSSRSWGNCKREAGMTQRLRGRAGVEQRKRRLLAEPLCRDCADQGRVTASTVPDHITPLTKGGSDDDTNIRCLCKGCHEVRTAEQFGHERRAALGACDATGLPTDPAHPWNRM